MSDTTQDAEGANKPMTLAKQVADAQRVVRSWSPDKRANVQLEGGLLNPRSYAAIRQAMGDDAAPTDRIGAALAAPGSERLRDYYATGPVQRASVETFVAALGVASLQSVASAETCRDAAGVAPAHPTQPEQPR